MTTERDLLGTWELKDWRVYRNGEFYKFPMGEDAKGQLIYTAAGVMSGFLMRADFQSEPARSDTQASKCLSYAGTFHIKGEDVHHDVFLSTIPEWIGGPLIRTIEWRGEDLLLKTSPEVGKDGNAYSNELLWQRREEIL
ncbi:lipocalin-like domain-containing protein [Sneathiella limimaris]|uniref:lipocalin-like domain-containing protein n=1 Tax=Sneathiella limimaris TaxID=1964213 RepID=UPI00146B9D5E|nr:lipocalin-like domain-containing protein [Sneathiella limimaris]